MARRRTAQAGGSQGTPDDTGAAVPAGGSRGVVRWGRRAGTLLCVLGASLVPVSAHTGFNVQVAAVSPPFVAPPDIPSNSALLGDADVERYRAIFAAQDAANWAAADALIGELEDRRLMGHVLADRLLHPDGYIASYAELTDWLESYADHPEAQRIYDLALTRRPYGASSPALPEAAAEFPATLVWRLGVTRCPSLQMSYAARDVERRIYRLRREERPQQARDLLDGTAGLTINEIDRLRGHVAAGLYYSGDVAEALEVAETAVARSAGRAEQSLWIAGLSLWRQGAFADAAQRFRALSTAECASAWERTAGAFWAARASVRAGDYLEVTGLLRQAADQPRTFYGMLARRVLGMDLSDFQFDPPAAGADAVAAVAGTPAGRRGLALLQVGEGVAAEGELLRIVPRADQPGLRDALINLAQTARLPRLAITLAHAYQPAPGAYYDGALYPLGPWHPDGGFAVEQALVHAIIREESRFDPAAVSPAGASGLMQLMPSTAAAMLEGPLGGRDRLFDPDFNLNLGQAYLLHLLDYGPTGQDLIRILVSYNAGPGSMLGWLEEVSHGSDPLLFIESIPSGESRAYAERVMTSLWIYRMRLGQPVPSLDDLAGGDWPAYRRLPPSQVAYAWQ
ncbi:MAG: lytic transglycosylase domain-containing protein [Rhodospirillaceae bacterium]|nr:lytic transglycosylase domain-containing protein [Rhodospirillaceae bacterium]